MPGFQSILQKIGFMVTHAQFGMLLRRVAHRLYSETISYGLRRDLLLPFTPPAVNVALTIRPITNRDIRILLHASGRQLDDHEREQRAARLLLLESGIQTCYVAATADDVPCFMMWLIPAAENDRLQKYFRNGYPPLKPDEAMVEFAFTIEEYRGKGIMAYAMAEIARQALSFGGRYVFAFVDRRNVGSIRRCREAGFVPHLVRKESCKLFRRTISYTQLPAGTPFPAEFSGEPAS